MHIMFLSHSFNFSFQFSELSLDMHSCFPPILQGQQVVSCKTHPESDLHSELFLNLITKINIENRIMRDKIMKRIG